MQNDSNTDKNKLAYSTYYNQPFVRTCTKCKEEKNINEFLVHHKHFSDYGRVCKQCKSKKARYYQEKNKEYYTLKRNEYYQKNKETLKLKTKNWRKNNPEKALIISRKAKKITKEKNREYAKRFRQNNPDKIKADVNKHQKRYCETLHDIYVKSSLKRVGFINDQITPELIEVKRLIIKTKRLCKTLQI